MPDRATPWPSLTVPVAQWVSGDKPAAPPKARVRPVPQLVQRMYAAARQTRTTVGFGGAQTSADAELHSSLSTMRARARQMVRDAGYARRARSLVVNNVLGSGMGMQAAVVNDRGQVRKPLNDQIEAEWTEWCRAENCHTGGKLHFHDLERMALGQVFEAGEIILRVWPQRFGASRVPLALEVIEAERIAGEVVEPPAPLQPGHELRMGVEVDEFDRPQFVWIRRRHPGDIRPGFRGEDYERVPASQLFHLHVVHRWPQTRGEPWLHATLRKLDDSNEYTQLELLAARGSAAYFATLESDPEAAPPPDDASELADEVDEDGRQTMNIEPLMVQELAYGRTLKFHAPNRPNTAMDPFMRYMLREVASGVDMSYASLSGDYSQSNYSSSRLALLDDRDGWRALQAWWIRAFREPFHRLWMQQAVLGRAVPVPLEQYAADIPKFAAVRFKPRGWSWIDPYKEGRAAKDAIRGGWDTLTGVVAATGDGRDLEDVIAERARELEALRAAGVVTDTDPTVDANGAERVDPADDPGQDPNQPAGSEPGDNGDPSGDGVQTPARRVVPLRGQAR